MATITSLNLFLKHNMFWHQALIDIDIYDAVLFGKGLFT